jgi:hypothetical protein
VYVTMKVVRGTEMVGKRWAKQTNIRTEDVDWIEQAQNRVRCCVLMKVVMDLRVVLRTRMFVIN